MKLVLTRTLDLTEKTIEEAKEDSMFYRSLGHKTTIVSDEAAKELTQEPWQDLTKIRSWSDIS